MKSIYGPNFAALDPDTRYLLCTVLSQKKDYKGARKIFAELSEVVGQNWKEQPIKQITTDGLASYKRAFEVEFKSDRHTSTKNPPKLVFGAGIGKPKNNNIMERVNNTIRGREKNYRGLKTDDTPMIPLLVAYYNLMREHQAVGKTPAAAAGIKVPTGKDKWIELIKQAGDWQREQSAELERLYDAPE